MIGEQTAIKWTCARCHRLLEVRIDGAFPRGAAVYRVGTDDLHECEIPAKPRRLKFRYADEASEVYRAMQPIQHSFLEGTQAILRASKVIEESLDNLAYHEQMNRQRSGPIPDEFFYEESPPHPSSTKVTPKAEKKQYSIWEEMQDLLPKGDPVDLGAVV